MNKLLQAIKQKFDYYYTKDLLSDNYQIQEQTIENNSFKYVFIKEFLEREELPYELTNKMDEYIDKCLGQDFQEWWRDNGNDYEAQHPEIAEDDIICIAYEEWLQSNQANGLWEQYETDYHVCNYIEFEFVADEFSSHVDVNFDTYYTTAYDNDKFNNESYSIMIEKDDLNDKMIQIINGKCNLFISHGVMEQPLDYFMDNYKINRIAKKIAKGWKIK